MTVYVDDVRHSFGRMIMCHMWADTLDELHDMADKIGIARRWFQEPPKASWEHYDISISKKIEALKRGARLTDKYGPSEFTNRIMLKCGDPILMTRAKIMLDRIAEIRNRPEKA